MPMLDLEAPAHFDELAVQQHMVITDASDNALDVTEWAANAAAPMSTRDLGERMDLCERFILGDIIEPMISDET